MSTPMFALRVLALSHLCTACAAAQEPAPARWELGAVAAGAVTPAYPGAGERTQGAAMLPYAIYRGERLRVENGGVTWRALRAPSFELDLGTSGALGSRASEVKVRKGMPDLGTLIEFGPRLTWRLGEGAGGGRWRVKLPLRGVFDLSDDLAYRGLILEPELEWARRSRTGWSYAASMSAVLADERFSDLYYQVDPAFATPARPAYDARAGLVTWRFGLSTARWLAPDWRVFAFARLDHVAGAANRASPLVERRAGASAGLGVQWVLWRSGQTADD